MKQNEGWSYPNENMPIECVKNLEVEIIITIDGKSFRKIGTAKTNLSNDFIMGFEHSHDVFFRRENNFIIDVNFMTWELSRWKYSEYSERY